MSAYQVEVRLTADSIDALDAIHHALADHTRTGPMTVIRQSEPGTNEMHWIGFCGIIVTTQSPWEHDLRKDVE